VGMGARLVHVTVDGLGGLWVPTLVIHIAVGRLVHIAVRWLVHIAVDGLFSVARIDATLIRVSAARLLQIAVERLLGSLGLVGLRRLLVSLLLLLLGLWGLGRLRCRGMGRRRDTHAKGFRHRPRLSTLIGGRRVDKLVQSGIRCRD
jgi:hypothetical protein